MSFYSCYIVVHVCLLQKIIYSEVYLKIVHLNIGTIGTDGKLKIFKNV